MSLESNYTKQIGLDVSTRAFCLRDQSCVANGNFAARISESLLVYLIESRAIAESACDTSIKTH